MPLFSDITKFQCHVNSPQRLAEMTDRCLNYAKMEMGPVQLNVPRDMFYGEVKVKIQQPKRIERSAGGQHSLNQAVELIMKAKNPVIVSGKMCYTNLKYSHIFPYAKN